MTKAAKFEPYNYEDQLRKAYPDQADKILVMYGWKERMPRSPVKLPDTLRVCDRCGEEFTPTTGRQLYCKKNSQGELCQKINKNQKLYLRRHAKNRIGKT